ncbi:hypothetical protein [Aureispira sp. CCB-E]|uniref:hypothetical protein n=1 Tax=Aureispira sp. CCB-E TaxID=3051121 RepID=UPI0028693248|nr:hypothetical protein [Aureispira sp. CCB-E]WMX17563.1 hypothetical protein QP953_28505 [Aureispira sp. CCB-E]
MARSLPLKLLPSQLSSLSKSTKTGVKGSQRTERFLYPQRTTNKAPGENPRVVSSVYGRLKTIILFFPTNGAYTVYPYFKFVKEFIEQFNGGGRRFLLVAESNVLSGSECDELSLLARQNGNTFYLIPIIYDSRDLAPWAQDCFLSITYTVDGEDQIYLVEPSNEASNKNVAKELVNSLEQITIPNFTIRHSDSPIPFVGGNVLVGDRFIIIGIHQSNRQLIRQFGKKWLGKNIIILESKSTDLSISWPECKITSDNFYNRYDASAKKQPLFHGDLFMTAAGKNKAGQEIFVIGEPTIGFALTDDIPADVKQLVKDIIIQTKCAINEVIRLLKKEFSDLNISFQIVRNPLPLTYYDEIVNERKTRHWCWASYNNCLVENYYDNSGLDARIVKNVIIPSYGINSDYSHRTCSKTGQSYGSWTELHSHDLQNQWLWEDLGYKVVLMRQDFNPFIRRQGSLNCLTNCIERE